MEYKRYADAKAFYEAVHPVLLVHEAQNTVPLGNVVLGRNGGEASGWRNPANRYSG